LDFRFSITEIYGREAKCLSVIVFVLVVTGAVALAQQPTKVPQKNGRGCMNRRVFDFICLLPTILLLTVFLVEAQQAKSVARIGYLSVLSRSADSTRIEAFRQGLRELGYVEAQNIAIESRYADGKLDRLPDLAGELVRLKVDVVIVGGSTATKAAKNVTKLIPNRHGAW
jgi:hypothetical protein